MNAKVKGGVVDNDTPVFGNRFQHIPTLHTKLLLLRTFHLAEQGLFSFELLFCNLF